MNDLNSNLKLPEEAPDKIVLSAADRKLCFDTVMVQVWMRPFRGILGENDFDYNVLCAYSVLRDRLVYHDIWVSLIADDKVGEFKFVPRLFRIWR